MKVSLQEASAGDHVVTLVGKEAAWVAVMALRAGWLSPREAEKLVPLARGIALILGEDLPPHRHAEGMTSLERDY